MILIITYLKFKFMNRNQFKLLELELGNIVKYKAKVSKKVGNVTDTDDLNNKTTKLPHPDLEMHFNDFLKMIAARVMGYTYIEESFNKMNLIGIEREAMLQLKKRFQDRREIEIDNTTVSKIKIKGDEDTVSIVLFGKHSLFHTGKHINYETPSISLNENVELYGFEEDLRGVVEYIQDEAFEFIFNDKVGYEPIDMDGEDEEEASVNFSEEESEDE